MNRLFWKIFFSFWLVMILVLVTNLTVTWVQASLFEKNEQNEHVAELANKALKIYRKEGETGYLNWRRELKRETELRVLLFNSSKHEVTGTPIPPHITALINGQYDDYRKRRDEYRTPFQWSNGKKRPVSWQLYDTSGEPFTFVVLNPHELSDHLYAKTTVLWRIAITTLMVAVIALVLSLYLVKPIRQLQATTRQLAGGDLSIRVPKKLHKRRDELGELSQDFDAMAEKIEALINGQQNMLRDVSHELRTPLARLRVALELARKRNGESAELDRMELEAERINALIDEIMQFVRLNASQQELRTEPVTLFALLNEIAEATHLSEQRIHIDCPREVQLQADRKLLERAIDNIVQNALKYSEGDVNIEIRKQERMIHISIRDHGPGVEAEQLEALFKPFYRTDEARGRSTGGYGLGLAIAAQAIKAHGGTIKAKNHPEGGLEVTLQLHA